MIVVPKIVLVIVAVLCAQLTKIVEDQAIHLPRPHVSTALVGMALQDTLAGQIFGHQVDQVVTKQETLFMLIVAMSIIWVHSIVAVQTTSL